LPESALANAVAAIKAVVRGRSEDAIGLLERGYPRVGSAYVPSGSLRADIIELANRARRGDARLTGRSREVRRVALTLLAETAPPPRTAVLRAGRQSGRSAVDSTRGQGMSY